MTGKVCAHEPAIESPVVFGVCRRVHADESVPGADVALEGGLLGAVEHVAGGGHEHHGGEPAQRLIGESRRILGGFDRKPVLGAERLHRGDAVGDRTVAEAFGA